MAEEASRSRLGRGLASLIGDLGAEANDRGRTQRRVPIELLKRNPYNPRRAFSEAQLDELAQSIRDRGIIQPLIVRPAGNDNYEIVAGERRWRAAQRAGLHEVPVVVVEVNDREAFQLAIIENVQRADLNPIEEANAYQRLATEFDYSQEEVAKTVGKSRPHVANTLRLLKLTRPVQELITANRLDAGHARILVGLDDQEELANLIVERGYSVRQVEAMIRERTARTASAPREPRSKDPNSRAFEKRLTDALGLQVTLNQRGDGGILHIRYSNLDQLDDIARKLEGTR
ncbi:MAG: ParB/RepB/Spo0J family partition protein [Xanthobacteraceae bacterium]|nr:ParB/RepB/Spo0J family partition protein [Xanthobacteraceae bacterium]